MRYFICILLSAGIAALCTGKQFDSYNQPFLSNMYAQVALGQKNEAVSNYVEAFSFYVRARDQLNVLISNGVVPIKDGRAQLKVRQKKIDELQPIAYKAMYLRVAQEYGMQLGDFNTASESNDLTAMNIALKNCEALYKRANQLYPKNSAPSYLPVLKPPGELKLEYYTKLTIARQQWIARENFSLYQVQIVSELMSATSLAIHTTWLDTAHKKLAPGITLEWLEHVYRILAVQEPTVYAYWYGLGNSLQLQRKPEGANIAWHDALKFFPDSLYLHYHLARTCSERADDAMRAMSHLRWLALRVDSPIWKGKVYQQMAIRYAQLGDMTNSYLYAERGAEQVAHELSDEAKALFVEAKRTKCSALLRLGRLDAAVVALEEAVRTAPNDLSLKLELADMFGNLATAHTQVDKTHLNSALLWYDTILRDYPNLPAIHASKSLLFLRNGEIMKAQAEAIREISIRPDSLSALTTLGFTYLSQQKTTEAKVLFKKALDFDPECTAALNGMEAVIKAEALETHSQ